MIVFCSPRCETVLGIPRLETVLGIPRYARDGRLSVLGLHTNRESRGFFASREPITESREQRFVSANDARREPITESRQLGFAENRQPTGPREALAAENDLLHSCENRLPSCYQASPHQSTRVDRLCAIALLAPATRLELT